ncbi:leucine-rich repeat domain-containing protein [Desulfosporosinus sp. OT]|uniref:leucine-rich repeat domain-containing protein n=1 Tax=Desulfosporosinus sp. OT TaxID=913865 RepID=UPI000223B204|nr:leucine-rich repeat domain-containing protein [Desulfosporosinus sp. OT]EGW39463.1 leucine-rich repeat (LRR) -like domain protein [Desulfosporosinus sp. OT]
MRILKISKVTTFMVGILMTAILLGGCSNKVQSIQPNQESDFTYIAIAGEAQIKKYIGAGGVVTIPSTFGGTYPVTSIGIDAFKDCRDLTSISLPQELISIGDEAFSGCWHLTTIRIPQGVTSIGRSAFKECTCLTTITIPLGVTSIGMGAFYDCKSLNTIRFNSATTTIPNAWDTIPATTTIIGNDPSTAKTYSTKYKNDFEVIALH